MFFNTFLNMACGLQLLKQSRNNNKWPNKKNDVITDLGGEGDFPMFLFAHRFSLLSRIIPCTAWPQGSHEAGASAGSLNCE